MNTPSKPPGHLFSKATEIMRATAPVKRPCETCGKMCDLAGAKACNDCWEVERRIDAYAKSINGRIRLKKVVERAEAELDARASKVVR